MKMAPASCIVAMLGGALLIPPSTFAEKPTKAAFTRPGPGGSSGQPPHNVSKVQDEVSAFPQPEIRRSHDGALETTLDARIADNQMTDQLTGETRTIHTPTYEGTIPGPTLEVRPGDTLAINLVNDLPPNEPGHRAGAFPHDFHTLNLHTHGLQVSPLGISDNIFRIMEPGTTNAIKIDIPRDHPSGTYWYHPHVHGTVTYQFVSGMAGFLIVKGGRGTLDDVPEVKAAKDVVMGFQVIRTDLNGEVPFVNDQATLFGTFPGATDPTLQGPWSTFGLDGAPGRSFYYFTTNGVTNPTLHMRPGEVQRWRLLDAAQGENLLLSLQGHDLNVVAMDGITTPNVITVTSGTPLVLGPGQRYDVLVKAGAPGTYQLQALDPATLASVTPSGIDPQPRNERMSFDFPVPCSTNPLGANSSPSCAGQLTYPLPLATIAVDGDPVDMELPTGPLPAPKGLPSMDAMLNTTPSAERHVAFEICGDVMGTPIGLTIPMGEPENRPPSCGWYFAKYNATYWGGTPFRSLEMMRDDDDKGVPNNDPNMPLVNFVKDGLFNPDQPLFDDMIAGNYEEWTVLNRSFSDHPFHIHQNHFLLTKINGKPLATPEWHDTVIVPGSQPQPTGFPPSVNINTNPIGSITFRIYFNPVTVGCFVAHCHVLTHEDLGMMQRLDILPGPGQPTQCEIQAMSHIDGSYKQTAIDRAAIGGPFTLVNATGKPVTDRDFLNEYLLVYFGYTYCPDNCPTTLITLTQALDKLGAKAERIQPLFITVDPKRDTPSVIGRYTAAFSPRLIGLTGSNEQIAAAEKEYRVYAAKHRTGPGPNDYAIEHSSIIYLIGPDGRFIAPVRADQDGTAMATEIASYLR